MLGVRSLAGISVAKFEAYKDSMRCASPGMKGCGGVVATCWVWEVRERGHPARRRSPVERRGHGRATRRRSPGGCLEPRRYVAGRVGPDLFVADDTPSFLHSTQTALAKTLKLVVVHCQGTCALGKQSPISCSGMIAAFRKLWAKILALSERHYLRHQRSGAMGAPQLLLCRLRPSMPLVFATLSRNVSRLRMLPTASP